MLSRNVLHLRTVGRWVLAIGEVDPAPPAEAEPEHEEQIFERGAGDRHPDLSRVREIDDRFATRRFSYFEQRLLVWPLDGSPITNAPL